MTELPDILSSANPEGTLITGRKAINVTRNLLQNIDLTTHAPNEILTALRQANIGITIPSFYDAYSEISGNKVRSQRIRYVNQDFVPSERVLEPSLYSLPTSYRVVHLVTYIDNETGAEITREFSLDTNTLSTIADMQRQTIEAMESKYPIKVTEIRTIRGYIAPLQG